MSDDERTPQERIRAFTDAVEEEIVTPTRRYLRGLRRGIAMGVILGILYAPRPGGESRAQILRFWRAVARYLPQRA
ncbi:MAG: hypothetical protein ACRENX_08645 [Candidatus Dormibacteria bacterium]